MLALNSLSEYENEKTKILKPWFNVFSDYLVILLLAVPIFAGGMELASGRYVCLPAVDCSMSNNASLCQNSTDTNRKTIIVVTKLKYTRDYDYVNSECSKTAFPWFHSYFSLLLFGQAFTLLLVNNLWLKYPWTASFVTSFYTLAEECYNLPGAHFATLTPNYEEESVTTSTIESTEDSAGVDVSTAVAVKTLYEKIRRFNGYVKTSKQIQYVYLVQAALQALLTVIFFILNVCFKNIKGTAKCSVDEYFPVIYDYFTCSHNLSTLLEIALVLFLYILVALFVFSIFIVLWTINKVFSKKRYQFEKELKGWRLPSDLIATKRDMGFLLHLLHAYNVLYTVQFAIYMSKEHNRKIKAVILDNDWPVETLDRCFYNDRTALDLKGLSGIPSSLFQFNESTGKLRKLKLHGCGPLQANDFDEFGKFCNLSMLSLINCGLTKMPYKLFNLKTLEILCLRHNSIKEIQRGICSLEVLEEFDISYNKLKTIDRSIGTLLSLRCINISNNPYISLPDTVNNVLACKNLKKLIVSDGGKILSSFGKHAKVEKKFKRVMVQDDISGDAEDI